MKKLILHISIILVGAFSVFSCVQPLDPTLRNSTGAPQLNLSVRCQEPTTKAGNNGNYPDYPVGENDYNENVIKYVDWFVFRDTTAGNDAVWQSGRVTYSEDGIADGTTEFLVANVDMRSFIGSATSATGYVFTVANFPEAHSEFSGKSFHQILEMGYVTSELDAMITEKFAPLSSFVMTSTVEKFTLTENEPTAKVNALLSRQMAKLSLDISIVPFIDEMKAHVSGRDTLWLDYIQTWYPDVQNIRAYLSYADKHGNLRKVTSETDPALIDEYDNTNFFTYNSYGFRSKVTYRNDNPHDTAYVSGSPFYSYPMRWETSDPHAPFIKIILAWKPVVEQTTKVDHNFINHTTGQPVAGGYTYEVDNYSFPEDVSSGNQKFYYKIAIPSDHNILQSNVWTMINLDVAILGGIEEENAVEVAGQYYVLNWSDPGIRGGGHLTSGKYLSLATPRDTFYIYGTNSIEIPVLSSHNLVVGSTKSRITKAQRWNPKLTGNNKWQNITRGSLSADGRSSLTFTNALHTTINANLDCYKMMFDVRIVNDAGLEKDIVIIQYPAIYIDTKPGGNSMVDGYYGNVNGYYQDYAGAGSREFTLNSFVNSTNTYTNNQVTVTFDGHFSYENSTRMRVSSNTDQNTITISPASGRTITQIDIGYRNNYGPQYASWTPNGTSSSTTRWRGSSTSPVSVVLTSTSSNRITVSSITVTYSAPAGPGNSGKSTEDTGSNNITQTPYSPIHRYVSTTDQRDMVVISISSLSKNPTYEIPGASGSPFTYLIADPRQASNYGEDDLVPYFNGTTTVPWGDDASKIKVGNTTTTNFIAPRFLISSRWSRMGNWQPSASMTAAERLEVVQKRCATYQEAGYPAGRWRLPTEAEIAFIANLQIYDFIDDLFTATGYSISASGSVFTVDNSIHYNQRLGTSCRCVYDLWYWGEDPVQGAESTYTVAVE